LSLHNSLSSPSSFRETLSRKSSVVVVAVVVVVVVVETVQATKIRVQWMVRGGEEATAKTKLTGVCSMLFYLLILSFWSPL
jgi:hypothetical protein